MAPDARNLLVIMSDEHSVKTLGCYGSPVARTPHLDALATRGTRFANAYCCNPVCIPARASFATGRYSHEIGYWDNADPYEGSVPSWHHLLRARGHRVDAIGKLHFRGTDDDNGFSAEHIPMHVIDGKGDLLGLVREDLPERKGAWKMAGMAGPGESMYTRYDRDIAARAQVWLHEEAPRHRDRPWVLFVSFVAPHFPLTAPAEHFYAYYESDALPWPKLYARGERPEHPFLRDYAGSFVYDRHFDSPDKVRRAVAGYYGLCTFLDEQVGKVLQALEATGLAASTRVLYTSDHGDNLGARGLWGKSTMYEEAAAVPLIVAGAGIPAAGVVDVAASHVDVWPFVFDATGTRDDATVPPDRHGVSLFDLARGAEPSRTVLSEYHGMGSTTAAFMVRLGQYKYVHYVAYPPQLFDLAEDPEEEVDRGSDPALAAVRREAHARLTALLDPAAVDARAKARQAELLAANGGRAAVIARGDLGFSVPPGVEPMFD
jgi:choline-sulfatase